MYIDNRWLLLLAVASAAAFASKSRRRRRRTARAREDKADIKSWENEGGNLAPTPAAPAPA